MDYHVRAGLASYKKNSKALSESSERQRRKSVKRYLLENKHCGQCGKRLPYEKRRSDFCDRHCSARFYNHSKRKRCRCGNVTVPSHRRCETCINNRVNLPFLSDARSDQLRRKILIGKHGHACFKCKHKTWNGESIPLELHHADGDSDNNVEENLFLLCPNCHAQTPTYKGKNKWRGSSRQIKRMAKLREQAAALAPPTG